MKQVKFKTFVLRQEDIKRERQVIDAQGLVLGQLATRAAVLLTGKNKIGFTPHTDNGDYVTVINAKEVVATGNKEHGKVYARHTNYPGGFRSETLAQKRARKPEEIITLAVKNMLPKNRTRKDRLARLKVYAGAAPVKVAAVAAKVGAEAKVAAPKTEKVESTEQKAQ